MIPNFEFAWHSATFLLLCLLLFVIAQLAFRAFNSSFNINDELTEKDNLGFFMGYIGYLAGFLMIIGGVMNSDGSGEFVSEIIYSVIYGLVGIIALNVTSIFLDKIIHPKVNLWNEITEHSNTAIGILKGSNFFSTGLIIGGVLLTEVEKPLETAIFMVLAILAGSIGFFYYNIITPFNIKDQIYKGNQAVAISATGAQIGFAILIYSGFQIVHTNWQESLITIGVDVAAGFLILPIIRFIVDRVFLPKRKLTDEIINQEKPNIGAGLFEAVSYIAGALLFVWCWNL